MGRARGVELRDKSIRVVFIWQGKQRREKLDLRPTPANIKYAERLVAEIKSKISVGTFDYAATFPNSPHAAESATDTPTFADACELYLETKGRLADATQSQYRNALEFWKGKFGADTRINLITHGKIAAAVGGHPWPSAKLCNNYLIPLRGTFILAGRDMRDVVNPIEGIENSKHQKTPPDPLTIVEMERILADMTERFDLQVAHYFIFAFLTGMRPEEIIAIRWDDIDWNNRTICVSRAKTFKGGLKDLKTSEVRDVDLVDRAMNMLQAQKRFTYMKRAEIFENPVTGRPWHDERSQRDHYWKPCLKKLGIRARRAYQTRHTYATTALMAGVNPAYIARQLGHANAKMLFTVYAKWIDAADRGREKAKMEAVLRFHS
ncbi:site-specific integrase [Collimonas sp.]|jgi:integrase|uniref:site-specific integrase n=1 Tax=Collimonas sp. TaxID=1963772 RepID=UPI002CF36A83|nr:site-specific integrase [Collimonas sp.]HWX01391.1 site-specific integrase [Collimonas sp.]